MPTDSIAVTDDRIARVCVIGSFAEALVLTADRIPEPGETLIGRDYRQTFGGKGSDMAVQAARLNAEVSFLGVIGDDSFGEGFVDLMRQENVDISHIRITGERPSGVGLILKDVLARNVIVVDMGANELFAPADIDAGIEHIRNADVVLAQLEIPLATALYALKRGRKLGVRTILNPAPAVDLTGADLSDIDIITPNETEARVIVGLPPDSVVPNSEIARRLMAQGAGTVVMTLGDKGAEVFTPTGSTSIPVHRIEVVDSNGAGDSFNAGLAVALGEGADIVAAARFAGTVAALSCTRWETIPSYHDRTQVAQFLGLAARDSARERVDAH